MTISSTTPSTPSSTAARDLDYGISLLVGALMRRAWQFLGVAEHTAAAANRHDSAALTAGALAMAEHAEQLASIAQELSAAADALTAAHAGDPTKRT